MSPSVWPALVSVLLLACGATVATTARRASPPDAPPRVALQLEGPCLAYAHRVHLRDVGGAELREEGALYLERGPDDRLRVDIDGAREDEHRPFAVSDADAVELYFPAPPEPLPARRRVTLPRLEVPDRIAEVAYDEEVRVTGRTGDVVTVAIERRVPVGDDEIAMRGQGRFDLTRGRWLDVRYTFHTGAPDDPAPFDAGSVELELDEAETARRAETLARLDEARRAGFDAYDGYATANPGETELERIRAA